MVNNGLDNWWRIDPTTPTNFPGDIPKSSEAAKAERKHEVPAAVSQLKLYIAAYMEGSGVIGGTRMMASWRPGTPN